MNQQFDIKCIKPDPQLGICETNVQPVVAAVQEDNIYFNNATRVSLSAMDNTGLVAAFPSGILLRTSGPATLLLANPTSPSGNVSIVASPADAILQSAVLINNAGVYRVEVSLPFESTHTSTAAPSAPTGQYFACMIGLAGVAPTLNAQTVVGNGSTVGPSTIAGPQGGGGVITGSQTFTFAGGEILDFYVTISGRVNADAMVNPTFVFPGTVPFIRITRLEIA